MTISSITPLPPAFFRMEDLDIFSSKSNPYVVDATQKSPVGPTTEGGFYLVNSMEFQPQLVRIFEKSQKNTVSINILKGLNLNVFTLFVNLGKLCISRDTIHYNPLNNPHFAHLEEAVLASQRNGKLRSATAAEKS